ncbi:MAG: RagB/SusD family nutrient uptake outer membrane protein [Saprospiraceae bacterium]|nr:RagB/SusD family nutrient uptake outer membrane protein [Saprospiraceae bacterium]
MKNLNIIILILVLFGFQSCSDDYLSPSPTSAVGALGYYTDAAQLETGVINMYDGIQGINSTTTSDNHAIQVEFYLTEMRSDNTRTKNGEGEPAQFDNFSVEPTNGIVNDYYRSFYNVIYRANTVLENLGVASGDVAAQFEGEAKFVRAYAYFNLVRLFGDVPLVSTVIGPEDTDVQFTRVDKNEIYNLIVSDLETASSNLDDRYRTRASKSAAQGLLAKVHLTLGNYVEAQSLCESVMAAGYQLEPNFKDIFYTEANSEVIFAIGFINDDSKDSQNFSAEWLNAVGRTAGVNYATTEAVAALDAMGGNRTAYSYRIDAIQNEQNQVVKYLPNGDESLEIEPTSSDPTLAGNDWIVLRYADILLMHVEAIIGASESTTSSAAIASFQAIRDRAGIEGDVTIITKTDLLNERRVELAFENQRLFDLIRFGVAQSVLSDFAANNGYSFTANDLLLPLPTQEIGLSNGVLTQNPGY